MLHRGSPESKNYSFFFRMTGSNRSKQIRLYAERTTPISASLGLSHQYFIEIVYEKNMAVL